MRVLLGWILALGLMASPAIAGTGAEAGTDSPANAVNAPAGSAAAGTAAKTTADAKSDDSNLGTLTAAAEPSSASAASTSKPAAAPAPDPQNDQNPLQIRVGDALITPIGFMDLTGVFRNHNAGGGIGSNFGSIPYGLTAIGGSPNPLNALSEARLSMQNSRIGARFDAVVKGAHVIGYFEMDFLGALPTTAGGASVSGGSGNVAVSSNSNTVRSRLYWVDVAKGKWEVLGGQTWSLITPGRVGISPIPGNIFFSNDIDVNYQAGLVWGRIPEFRFVFHPSSKAAIAFALDNQEQYAGGSAGGPTIVLPATATSAGGVGALLGTQLNNGTTGVNAPAVFPDVIVKLAFDPSAKFHIEVGGVERQFRDAVNTTTATTSPLVHHGMTGGGIFVNLNFQLFNGFRVLTNNFWSEGGGRYIFGQVPDAIINPDGSFSAINASSTVTGIEYTHKNMLLYAYYGGIYAAKNLGTTTIGPFTSATPFGYGVPGTLTQNRSFQEGTVGFNQTLWRDAKYGALNLMGQYSYLQRDPWGLTTGISPNNANMSLAFANLRYTLPGGAPAVSALKAN
jgi:hypothetical protein